MPSRKDYVAVAKAIKSSRVNPQTLNLAADYLEHPDVAAVTKSFALPPKATIRGLRGMAKDADKACELTADYFASDNPRFDRKRYLKACGVE